MKANAVSGIAWILVSLALDACGSGTAQQAAGDSGGGNSSGQTPGGDSSVPSTGDSSVPSTGDSSVPSTGDSSAPSRGGSSTPGGDSSTDGIASDGENGGYADAGTAPATKITTVFVIVMENNNWSSINGSSAAPYINSLLPKASSCKNYFDNPKSLHPSEPNYIWIESGGDLVPLSGLDGDPSAIVSSGADHLVAQLTKANVSWKSYQEDLPAGHCGIQSSGNYAAKHNPMVFFHDISGSPPSDTSPECLKHVVPYTSFATDLSNDAVAQYNFITPNLCHDMHGTGSCPASITTGDMWLSQEVPRILASKAYNGGGALFITWDESEGGEVPIGMIVLSPLAKGGGYVSSLKYFHSSLLASVENIFGVPLLNDAANQPDLSDLFTAPLK